MFGTRKKGHPKHAIWAVDFGFAWCTLSCHAHKVGRNTRRHAQPNVSSFSIVLLGDWATETRQFPHTFCVCEYNVAQQYGQNQYPFGGVAWMPVCGSPQKNKKHNTKIAADRKNMNTYITDRIRRRQSRTARVCMKSITQSHAYDV